MKAYGVLELTSASPAQTFTEPLSLAVLKTYLRHVDTGDSSVDDPIDTELNAMISAARDIAETYQGRDLISKQYDLHLDVLLGYEALAAGAMYPSLYNWVYPFGVSEAIQLRQPLTSVDLFQYTDSDGTVTTMVADTDYVVDLHRGVVVPPYGQTWPFFTPAVSNSVLIRFTSGYTSSDAFWSNQGKTILQGMKMLINSWREKREPFQTGVGVQELPFAVTTLFSMGARPRVV